MAIKKIQNQIYRIRGQQVMLDRDLAVFYTSHTKRIIEIVKRHKKRFPTDFMFRLTKREYEQVLLQAKKGMYLDEDLLRSQIATLKGGRGKHTKYLPYAFTEQGIAMLSGLLNSDVAIKINIAIMRAFVEIRKFLTEQSDFSDQLKQLRDEVQERLGSHDAQLAHIYDAIENLLDKKVSEVSWNERRRIGFKS